MVLHREDRVLPVLHAFDRTVIEVEMGHFKRLRTRNATRIAAHREPVVLRRYKYLSCRNIAHRMITPPMSVRQLHGLATQSEAEQLMTETDAEDRQRAVGQFAQRLDRVRHGG